MLYSLIIEPIELAFEACFSLIYIITHDIGISIIFLSIVVNIIILPLYLKADSIQEEESQKQLLMEHWTNHIRKNFKKDERYMILNTYYRETKYHPIYALRGTVSLLLQIPFFIAAYHFLSTFGKLNGAAFMVVMTILQSRYRKELRR